MTAPTLPRYTASADCPAKSTASWTGSTGATTSTERRLADGTLEVSDVHEYDRATDSCTGCPAPVVVEALPTCRVEVAFRDFDGSAASLECGHVAARRVLLVDDFPTAAIEPAAAATEVVDVCTAHYAELLEETGSDVRAYGVRVTVVGDVAL